MGATTSPSDVRAINGSSLDDNVVQPFVDAAICIVDGLSNCTTANGISQACLDNGAAWLGAHLLAMSAIGADTATVKKESFENWSVERVVGGFSGKGVLSTTYGQTANTLLGGCLEESDKAPASLFFFG